MQLVVLGLSVGCAGDSGIRRDGSDAIWLRDDRGLMVPISVKPIASGRLTSRFGDPRGGWWNRRVHQGIDYAAPTGTPVYAAGVGCVTTMERRGGYGRFVLLRHDQQIETAYAHLSSYAAGLTPGQCLSRGDILGYVGSSGNATGAHLHFEVRYRGEAVDPLAD